MSSFPTDEVHHFSEGLVNHQPAGYYWMIPDDPVSRPAIRSVHSNAAPSMSSHADRRTFSLLAAKNDQEI